MNSIAPSPFTLLSPSGTPATTAPCSSAPPGAPPGEPQVLRCASTADFLAALPFITGFTASNSLFLVLFQGRRAEHVLRFDLPDEQRDPGGEQLIDTVVHMLRETGAGDEAPALVAVTDRSFGAGQRTPWVRLMRRLKRRFRAERWELRELAVVAADGWIGLLAPGGAPRPLSEIMRSRISDEVAALQRQPAPIDQLAMLPAPDQERKHAVAQRLVELERRRQARSTHPAANAPPSGVWMHGTARVAEACFTAGDSNPATTDPRLLARLIEAAGQQDRWLVIALTALTRAEFISALAEGREGDRFTEMPLDAQTPDASRSGDSWSIRALLQSLSYETPEPQKLHRAIAALGDAAAHAPLDQRPGLLALLGWAWWMLGLQSVGRDCLAQSFAIDDKHELSRMVERLSETPPAYRLLALREKFAA